MIHSYSGDLTTLLENALNIENAETIKDKMRINDTTAITIDYYKTFDLGDYTTLENKLVELGVRTQLLKLMISFLSNRKHYIMVNCW